MTIQEMLGDYLWDSISVRDTAVRKKMKENFYHGMLLGLLQNRDSWMVNPMQRQEKAIVIFPFKHRNEQGL